MLFTSHCFYIICTWAEMVDLNSSLEFEFYLIWMVHVLVLASLLMHIVNIFSA